MDLPPDAHGLGQHRGPTALGTCLILSYQQQELTLDVHGSAMLGRGLGADLRIERHFASREHLIIVRRDQYFVVVDQSTNGTFIQTEDRAVTHIKRTGQRLWGSGWLCLGEPLRRDGAVHFRQATAA